MSEAERSIILNEPTLSCLHHPANMFVSEFTTIGALTQTTRQELIDVSKRLIKELRRRQRILYDDVTSEEVVGDVERVLNEFSLALKTE
jgi:hypothetical protein